MLNPIYEYMAERNMAFCYGQDGQIYSLYDLKELDLNKRLSLPHKVFVALDKLLN